ncbi:MAG TPA: ABC transporter permease [Vicinamibacterales bacterium]|nr:ABC transporter permease [Vicinamibacterales bacterium]
MNATSRFLRLLTRPHLLFIAVVGILVPRRLRADWREEWEAELQHRERLLAEWDRLDWSSRRELLRRSGSAFWDAIGLQRHRWEDAIVQDVRYGVRTLATQPAFTVVAVLTLALGVGANTAIFTVVNALLLRPLGGVVDPGSLVSIGRQYSDKSYLSDATYPDFRDYRDQNTVLSGLAATVPAAFNLSDSRASERVEGELVSGHYFDVLGISAAAGRLIAPFDDRGSSPAPLVAVISGRLWQRRFGGDPAIVGAAIRLDGHEFTIVGVADTSFSGTRVGAPRDVWVPIAALYRTDPKTAARLDQRRASWVQMFGRLKPATTIDRARAEFAAIAERLEREHPDTNARAGAGVVPGLGRDPETGRQVRRFAFVPLAAVGIVLLIACANVAGLLIARAGARQREIATRLAVGAGRVRLVRQLLTESLTLALAGGAAGAIVGRWLTSWLRSLLPDRYLFLSFDLDFGGDWRVFAFTFVVAGATGVLFGLVPALQASRSDVVAILKGSSASARPAGSGLRGALVVAQIALSLVLLVAAGLCVRTLRNAAAIDIGYDLAPVLTARLDLAKQRYTPARGAQFHQQLLDRLHATPGVQAAAYAVTLPLNDGRWEDGIRRQEDPARVQTFQNLVSSRYFEVMRIPLSAGRGFTDADDDRAPLVAVLNQTLASRLWPNQNAVGHRLVFKGRTIDVVGVVRDIKGRNLFEPPGPMLYLPLTQDYSSSLVLHVRAAGAAAALGEALRREVRALDADLPIYGVRPLEDHLVATLTPQRLLAHLTTGVGVLALVLAAIGLYGLLGQAVTARTPEIGVRMALGAERSDVLWQFVARGLRFALAGAGIGLVAAALLMPLLRSVLFGVSPLDPLTFTLIPAILLVTALLACVLPAYRAARADPTTALRCE